MHKALEGVKPLLPFAGPSECSSALCPAPPAQVPPPSPQPLPPAGFHCPLCSPNKASPRSPCPVCLASGEQKVAGARDRGRGPHNEGGGQHGGWGAGPGCSRRLTHPAARSGLGWNGRTSKAEAVEDIWVSDGPRPLARPQAGPLVASWGLSLSQASGEETPVPAPRPRGGRGDPEGWEEETDSQLPRWPGLLLRAPWVAADPWAGLSTACPGTGPEGEEVDPGSNRLRPQKQDLSHALLL